MSKSSQAQVPAVQAAVSGALTGRYDHALDGKKRVTLPSEWRSLMGNPEYIYAMPDRKLKCVNLIPVAEMDVFLAKLREKALFDSALNGVLQVIGANAAMLPFDVQGRIRISDKLLAFANLSGTLALVGSVRMIRVWNPAALGPADYVDQSALDAAFSAAGM